MSPPICTAGAWLVFFRPPTAPQSANMGGGVTVVLIR